MPRHAPLALGTLAVLPGLAFAQEAPPAQRELPAVVVTATRQPEDALLVPAAIDAIDARDMHRAQPGIDLAESLQRIPGVVARDRHNDAQDLQISIRGFGARATFGVRGVRLYTDGVPATMPDGQGQVSHFSLDSAERIEVLRGPFSALYGNASGGVIALFTAPPPPTPEFRADLVLGDAGMTKASLGWRGPLDAQEGLGLAVDAMQVDSEGSRAHSASRRRVVQASAQGDLGAATRYTLQFGTLDLAAQDPQGLNAGELAGDREAASPNALKFDTRKSVRQRQAGARIEHDFGATQRLTLTAYAGTRRTAQMLSVPVAAQAAPTSGGGAIDLDRDYGGVDLRWRWSGRWLARPFTLTAGIQRETSDEARRGFENFVGATLGVRGALRRDEQDRVDGDDQYLQASWQPADRWRIDVGARHSRVRFATRDRYIAPGNPDDSGALEYARTLPVAGVLFRVTPWLSAYANAGSGFETPTFAELAYRGDGASGLNDALRPARSRNVEAGLRARRGETAWSLALFDTRTRDELVVASNDGGRSVYANAGTSRRRGLELAASRTLSPRWHVAGDYTWLDARYLDDPSCAATPCTPRLAGHRIPGLSRHSGWGELRFSPDADTDVVLDAQAAGRVPANDANDAAAPGYARIDLGVERRFRIGAARWRGYARIDNLLDRRIIGSVIVNEANGRYFEPAPGRGWSLGLDLQFGLR
jgi:iron complex outermembrane receptor protein